jgi:hypothetical protein
VMHGREKSDSAIVAGKPTNKAVPTAAEPVERRAGAKGNANQQSTDRAQNRATVSQALERIRKVAKERKKERFTALFHHISIDLLEAARLPAIHNFRQHVELGGLMSYGVADTPSFRRAAYFVDRILKGARPADLSSFHRRWSW